MPPRDALVPLIKLAGTAVVATIAYRYGSKHVVAAAHRQHDGRSRKATRETAEDAELSAKKEKQRALGAVAAKENAKQEEIVAEIPRSSLIVAMLLQDGNLLVSVFGVLVMVLAVMVSLAIVAMDDSVASLDELQMFAPLMCIGMTLVAVGMLNSMLRGPPKKHDGVRSAPARCPFSGAVASMPVEKMPKKDGDAAVESESEDSDDGEQTEKRVSKCPFGFG
uniref:Transmembrane protein n=1 Tax=Globisporangium ultimum (strain ATCC 200006 / CBS 805.95 / DAOM BR144) TaxID=431595 RepID=K3X623_GLOUD